MPKIIKVVVDEMPESCGDCPLMHWKSDHGSPACFALPEEVNEITGDPYDMTYRRSDCPLWVGFRRLKALDKLKTKW